MINIYYVVDLIFICNGVLSDDYGNGSHNSDAYYGTYQCSFFSFAILFLKNRVLFVEQAIWEF